MPVKAKLSGNAAIRLDFDDKTIQIALVRRHSARRFILRVRSVHRDVRLTMPPRSSLLEAQAFVEGHQDWIRHRIDSFPAPCSLRHGALFPYGGQLHKIIYVRGASDSVHIHPAGSCPYNQMADPSYPSLCIAVMESQHKPNATLSSWLKARAKEKLTEAALAYASVLDVSFSRIAVRDQKTRWGSCSTSGTLTFSWRLIMAPPYVLDYLVAHEVVHLRHMDHSRAFWSLLRTICPATDMAEKWLKNVGQDLHLYDIG